MMELNGGLMVEQKQALSVKQTQSLQILSLTNQELEDFLMNEYLENPMLENQNDKENDMISNVEKFYEQGISYREQYMNNPDEEEQKRYDISASDENRLKESLLGQLDRKHYSKRQWKLIEYLIECLDEKGYLLHSVEELSEASGYAEQEIEDCLNQLKKLEPYGIFAESLGECLRIQLEMKGIEDEVLFRLLEEHLQNLMNGQIGAISRDLGISTVQVKEYLHLIGSLNPRPVMDIQESGSSYIVPDIIVTRQGERWEVTINDQWMGEYRYSGYYMKLMAETKDPELCSYFKERLERARFVIGCVEQRRKTIIRIVEEILKMQQPYFEGKGPLAPMRQEDLAEALGIHPSTVSRAVKGKYIQYRKTIPMKSLFTTAVSGKQEGVSSDRIKERIRILIEGEGAHPLSDQRLAECLKEEGISISRRAVAKYRVQMNIPDSRQRSLLL